MRRRSIAFTIISFTIALFIGCAGVTKQILHTGEEEALVKIIIDDEWVKHIDHGSNLVNELKEVFGKTFNEVSINSGYNKPKLGEYVIKPLGLQLSLERIPDPDVAGGIATARSRISVGDRNEYKVFHIHGEGRYRAWLIEHLIAIVTAVPTFGATLFAQEAYMKKIATGRALESVAIDLHNKVVSAPEFKRYALSSKMAKTAG